MKEIPIRLAAILAAAALTASCATRPVGGSTPPPTEGQTLGGYVATGAVDPDEPEIARPGDDDETTSGTPAEEPAPPPD